MNILIGLGNPGEKYQHTRHNVGFLFVDFVAKKLNLPEFSMQKNVFSQVSKNVDIVLIKPQTFMNESGKAVSAAMNWFSGEAFIAYDDLDIPFGKFKIQKGSGPKVHNGLNSIREQIGEDGFWSIRIGVDDRGGDRTLPGHEYVLKNFSTEQMKLLQGLFEQIFVELSTKIQ